MASRASQQYYKTLTTSSRLRFDAALFCLFAPLGLAIDIASLGTNKWLAVGLMVAMSGGSAVCYGRGGFTGRYVPYFAAGLTVQFGSMWVLRRFALPAEIPVTLDADGIAALQARLTTDAGLLIALVVSGYTLFLTLWNREGIRFFGRGTEIRLAQRIHQKLVPDISGRTRDVEWAGVSRASGEIGGDLVDAIEGPAGMIGCVADVSGHGVGAGLLMGMFKTAFRAAAAETSEPSLILARTHVTLAGLTEPNMYITAAVVRCEGGALHVAGGGHPPVLIYRRGTGRVEEVASTGPAIALLDDFSCRSIELGLDRGDIALLLTDGITEAFDRRGDEVGVAGVAATLAAAAGDPLETLLAKVGALATRGTRADDQTLLAVRAL